MIINLELKRKLCLPIKTAIFISNASFTEKFYFDIGMYVCFCCTGFTEYTNTKQLAFIML